MAGTLRGKIDCYINTGSSANNAQNVFKNLHDFFVSHPNMTLIARNSGLGSGAVETAYHDQPGPFRTNAWAVFRMNDNTSEGGAVVSNSTSRTFPWYVYIQWNRGDLASWGDSPAAPSVFEGSSTSLSTEGKVGIQFAIPVGSIPGTSEVAWNGAGSLSFNTKGTPAWKKTAGTPAGFQGTFVFPRSNGPTGSHDTNRENCASLFYSNNDPSPVRMHVVADDDSLLVTLCPGDNSSSWQTNYFGLYTPRPGLSMTYPMVHLTESLSNGFALAPQVYGTVTGTARSGGIPMNTLADGVRSVTVGRYDEFYNALAQPNRMFTVERYDEMKIPIAVSENPFFGYAGEIDFIREVFNLSTHDTNSARTRVAIGGNTAQSVKMLMPWNGLTIPRSTFTRQGVSF